MQREDITLPIGTIIRDDHDNCYVLEEVLGTGGFSAVYKVKERHTQRLYAMKELINPGREDKRKITVEADLLMRLRHPSLPRVYSTFEQTSLRRIYLLMDYIEGKTLEVLRREQPGNRFPLAFVLSMIEPVVDALRYLHAQQPPVVHRDIKPSNIIVPDNAAGALLVDFGLAKEHVDDKTTSVFRYGTPGYAAPEQYRHGTNPRTDIYGLASTLYTLLTGTIPVDALTRITGQQEGDPLQRADLLCSDLPTTVGKVLERAMHLRGEQRFSSIEEFWQALRFAAEHLEEEGASTDLLASSPPVGAQFAVGAQFTSPQASSIRQNGPPQLDRRQPRPVRQREIISLALLIPGILVAGYLLFTHRTTSSASQPAIQSTVASSATSLSTRPQECATHPGAPPPASLYPQMALCYQGTINDIGVAKEKSGLYLTGIKQNQRNFSGIFHGLGVSGTIKGTIDQNGSVQFVVFITGKSDRLVFTGDSKYGGDMRGDFVAFDQNGRPTLDEYGDWYAQPLS